MWSILSTIAAIVSGLLGIPGMIARWQAKRQGRAEQRAADDAEALATVTRERDALMESGSAEEAARRGEF